MKATATTPAPWAFRSRFRRGAFGWRGSRLAMTRINEALAEIRAVARHDPASAAEGAVWLLERLSPALGQADSSSGALGRHAGVPDRHRRRRVRARQLRAVRRRAAGDRLRSPAPAGALTALVAVAWPACAARVSSRNWRRATRARCPTTRGSSVSTSAMGRAPIRTAHSCAPGALEPSSHTGAGERPIRSWPVG